MMSYQQLIRYFGVGLFDKSFQDFLAQTFSDLTHYDVLESDYVTSEEMGVELGFTNKSAAYDDDDGAVVETGKPVFSHLVLYPKSATLVHNLPFDISFGDNRLDIIQKAGPAAQTKDGHLALLGKRFFVDNYVLGNTVLSIDFNPEDERINFIQVRDNNLVEHLTV